MVVCRFKTTVLRNFYCELDHSVTAQSGIRNRRTVGLSSRSHVLEGHVLKITLFVPERRISQG